MAQEEIIFKLGVDTGNSAQQVDDVKESIEKVGNESKKAGGSFTNMRKELKQLTLQLQNLDPASKEFEEVSKRAGKIKEEMRGIADAINDADPEKFGGKFQRTAEGIAGSFSAITGAQALFGQNSEEIEKQMLKVQGAIALTQGISSMKELKNDALDFATSIKTKLVGAFTSLTTAELVNAEATGTMTLLQKAYTLAVGTSTGAMKVFKLALVSTGIGAIVILIGFLIEKVMEFSSSTDEATASQNRFTKAMEKFNNQQERNRKNLDNQLQFQMDFAKAVGMSEDGLYNLEKKGIEKRQRLRQSEFDDNLIHIKYLRQQKKDALEDENFELVKSINEEITKTKQKNNELIDEKYKLIQQDMLLTANHNREKVEDERKKNTEISKANKEAQQKKKEDDEKNAKLEKDLKEKITDLIIANINDEGVREITALQEKHRRELEEMQKQFGKKQEYAELEKQLKIQQGIEMEKLGKDLADKENSTEQEKQDKRNLDAKSKLEADLIRAENDFNLKQQKQIELENLDFKQQLQNKELTNGEIQKITAQHEANIVAIQNESKDRQIEIDNAIADAKMNLVNNIGSVFGALSGLFAQQSKQAKAFALVQLAIDTGVGFVQGLRIAQQSAQATGPGAMFSFPIFYAQQVGAVIGAVSKAKQILNAGTSVQAPRVPNASDNMNTGNVVDSGKSETIEAQTTYKVVVLDSDITKMQEKTKKVDTISSI